MAAFLWRLMSEPGGAGAAPFADPAAGAHHVDAVGRLFDRAITSGTQSNLCALLAHCGRGDEYIVGDMAHTYRWEGGGGAVLGGIQPQPMLADGLPDPSAIEVAVKPADDHFARTRLVCLANTKDGRAQSPARMHEAVRVVRTHGLATHLDGARMWNAAVALGLSGAELTAGFDTVAMRLSKGLGGGLRQAGAARRRARSARRDHGGGMGHQHDVRGGRGPNDPLAGAGSPRFNRGIEIRGVGCRGGEQRQS